MARHNTRTKATVLLALAPLMLLTGCSSVLGLGPRLAPEDEPYLFDRWDPDFELAKPCEDITDEDLVNAELRYFEDYGDSPYEGLDTCNFLTKEDDLVILSGAAYKIAMLEKDGIPLNYQLTGIQAPALVYRQNEEDTNCTVAAETSRGTVEVSFGASAFSDYSIEEKCAQAEHYFNELIGEKLDEYRANK